MLTFGVREYLPPLTLPPLPVNYLENGRLYHGSWKGKYMFPCDEQEMNCMDIYHKFFSVIRRGALHSAPFTPNFDGPRVLDLGTGTGIWAIDMADYLHIKHPNSGSEVVGIDLSNIQPEQIPPNLNFLVYRDLESPWHDIDIDSWDLIHIRMLNGSITSWPDIYGKVFRHLKPGFGWLEHVEIDIVPRCDDGSFPPNSQLANWARYLLDATARACRPIAYNIETQMMLERQGFVEIQEQIIKVPLNTWPADPHLKDIGRWYNFALTEGLEALTLGPLTKMCNWKKSAVDQLIVEIKREICSIKYHTYCYMHIWIARRPGG